MVIHFINYINHFFWNSFLKRRIIWCTLNNLNFWLQFLKLTASTFCMAGLCWFEFPLNHALHSIKWSSTDLMLGMTYDAILLGWNTCFKCSVYISAHSVSLQAEKLVNFKCRIDEVCMCSIFFIFLETITKWLKE